eukprot:m.918098 g.918098  ORF g.918098 m.918098 type:complete len:249 (+) comp60173_c0_seq1:655-1401(+)
MHQYKILAASTTSVDTTMLVNIRALDQFDNIVTTESRDVTLRATSPRRRRTLALLISSMASARFGSPNQVAESITLSLLDSAHTGADVSSSTTGTFVSGAAVCFVFRFSGSVQVGSFGRVYVQAHDKFGDRAVAELRDVQASANRRRDRRVFDGHSSGQGSFYLAATTVETVTLTMTDVQPTGLDVTHSITVTFTQGSSLSHTQVDEVLIELILSNTELNELKALMGFATSTSDTDLSSSARAGRSAR